MKQVIEGKVYNTETATKIADVSIQGYVSRSDFKYHETALYRTKKGAWFVAGNGGPLSQWARSTGDGGYSGGFGIRTLTSDEALELLEKHGATKAMEEYFSDQIEEA